MNHSMITAFSSMQAMQQKLDVLANNMANVNTTGYKRRDATFQDILTNVYRQPQGFDHEARLTPLGLPQGWGAKLGQIELSMEQGALNPTGNPLDVAIQGDAMFEVIRDSMDNDGNPNIAWTRDGGLQLTYDPANRESLVLATQRGELIRGLTNEPIRIPLNHSVRIDEDGRVYTIDPANPEAAAEQAGQLKLVRAVRPQVLVNEGDNLFTLPPGMTLEAANEVGVLRAVNPSVINTDTQTKIAVRQGFLEQSNVSLTDEMTELMTVQRAYQLNARAITSSDTLMNLTNNLRG